MRTVDAPMSAGIESTTNWIFTTRILVLERRGGHFNLQDHFLTSLKSRLRSPCQHLCKRRNVGTKSRWRRDSFSSKALLAMEIDALAARTSEC